MQKPKPTKMEIQNFQKQCTKNFYNPKNVVHENCIITATAEPLIYYSYEQNNTRSAKANGANGNLGSEQLCQNEQLHHQSHSFPSTGFGFHENYKVSSQRPHINLTRNGNEQQEKKMNEIEKEDDDEENFSDFDHVEDDEENLFDMNPQFLQSYANSNSNSNQIQNTKMKNMKIKEGENENEDEDEDDMGMELDDEDHDDKYNANSNGNIKMKEEEGPERPERIEKLYGNMSSIPSSFYDIATPTTITSNIGMGSGSYYIGNYPPPPSYSSYSYAYTNNNNYNYANENVNASELSKNYDILTSPLASQSNQIIEPVKEEEGEEENEQQQLKKEPEQIKSYSETMAEINSMLDPFTFISSHMPLCEIKNDEKEPPHVQKQNEYSQKPNYRPHITNSKGGGNSNANGYGNYSRTAATSNVPTVLSRSVSPTSDTDYYGNLSPISNETSVVSPRTLEELGNIAEALFSNGVFNNTNDASPNSSEGENNGDGSLFDSYRNQNQNQNQNSNPHSNIIPMIKKDPTSSMHGMIIPEFQSASSTCSSFSSSSSAPVGGYAQFPPPNISAKTSSIKWENPLTTPISPNCFYDTTIDNSASSVVPPASSTGSTISSNLLVQPPPIPIKLPSILCTPEITDINQQDPRRRSVSNASHRTILFCKKDNAINKSPHGGTPIVARRRHHSFDISALQYCQYPGCNKKKQGSYYCIKHGGGKRCIVEGCTKSIQSNQRCKAHGGGPRCIVPGCTKSSQGNGKCRRHGGGKRCTFVGCEKSAQWGTYCAQHGGSRICNVEGCSKRSRSQNRCAEHGGGKRCVIVECNKPARKGDKCAQHYREYIMQQQNALEVLHKQQQLQLQQQQQHSLERSIHSNESLANGSFMAQLNAFRESGGIHTVPVPSQSLPHPRHQFET